MMTVPSFQEDPLPVLDLIRAYVRLEGASPADTLAEQAGERERVTREVLDDVRSRGKLGRVPRRLQAVLIRVILGWTHGAVRYRERARLKQALLYSRCRRLALAAGERLVSSGLLDQPDEVFWLTVDEVDEALSGSAMLANSLRNLTALRSKAHAVASAVAPPATFTLPEGGYFPDGGIPQGDPESEREGLSASDGVLRGVSACGGRVKARARVLREVVEAGRLERGDVLVTCQTDPGWGPVFFLIGGLVIERGGMLSHGAIIAREFGIPCVVGVPDAVKRIPDGCRVDVDGDAGAVHVLG